MYTRFNSWNGSSSSPLVLPLLVLLCIPRGCLRIFLSPPPPESCVGYEFLEERKERERERERCYSPHIWKVKDVIQQCTWDNGCSGEIKGGGVRNGLALSEERRSNLIARSFGRSAAAAGMSLCYNTMRHAAYIVLLATQVATKVTGEKGSSSLTSLQYMSIVQAVQATRDIPALVSHVNKRRCFLLVSLFGLV